MSWSKEQHQKLLRHNLGVVKGVQENNARVRAQIQQKTRDASRERTERRMFDAARSAYPGLNHKSGLKHALKDTPHLFTNPKYHGKKC